MSKKIFMILGMLVSLAVAFCGLLVMDGSMGGSTNYAGTAPYSYDSGYATFGGDFYTFVNNNAAEAAEGARIAANNVRSIAQLLQDVCGIFLIGFGLMGFCAFGILGSGKKEAPVVVTVPAPVPESVPPYTPEQEYSEEEV